MSPSDPIPMVDLRAQYAALRGEIDAALARVVSSGRFIAGEECAAFEREFAAYCGVGHACGVANGTDALTLALRALGVGPGDQVVTVAFTFYAIAEAIALCGAEPRFVDVDPDCFTLDPALVEGAITPRTRAVVPVHLYGHPADMRALRDVCSRRGVPLLEDAAQAHGAEDRGRRVGGLGDAACFSFYPGKNLGAYGDAGMVVSDDSSLIARVRLLANHGAGAHRYQHQALGTNSRLDALQAAVLRVKLRHLDEWNAQRRELVRAYDAALAGVTDVALPRERPEVRSAWHLYTIRTPERDALRKRLEAEGIASAVHYPLPIHLQPAMLPAGGRAGDLPVSERLAREVLSLPLYPELPPAALQRVAHAVRSARAVAAGS